MKVNSVFNLGSVLVVLALGVLAPVCSALADPAIDTTVTSAASDKQLPAVAVAVVPVSHEPLNQPIKNSGRVSHKNETRLAFKTAGLIEKIWVEEGDAVKAGQLLATLDLEEINAQQLRAASNHKNAIADLQRFTKLYEDSLISLQVKQNAQLAADSAEAELQIANFNKKLSVIRASADGRVLKRFVEANELIQAGQTVFLLASNQQGSIVRLGLIDQDIVRVQAGDAASITLDAYPGRTFQGQISEIASSTDSNTGTFEVEVSIEDQGFNLRSGLIARVVIIPTGGQLQYAIPIESVYQAEQGAASIFVLDEEYSKANKIEVTLIKYLPDSVVVQGSLKASDKVITLGAPYLSDGRDVIVVSDNVLSSSDTL